jgi:hypothetical protein
MERIGRDLGSQGGSLRRSKRKRTSTNPTDPPKQSPPSNPQTGQAPPDPEDPDRLLANVIGQLLPNEPDERYERRLRSKGVFDFFDASGHLVATQSGRRLETRDAVYYFSGFTGLKLVNAEDGVRLISPPMFGPLAFTTRHKIRVRCETTSPRAQENTRLRLVCESGETVALAKWIPPQSPSSGRRERRFDWFRNCEVLVRRDQMTGVPSDALVAWTCTLLDKSSAPEEQGSVV